jgi:hypothetical protein
MGSKAGHLHLSPRVNSGTLTCRANHFGFTETLSSPKIKNISLSNSENQHYNLTCPVPIEGRIAIVTLRKARDAVDAERQARLISQGGMNPVSDCRCAIDE